MNTHVKTITGEPADLSRRSFLVGSAAVGLALGYSAVPGLLGADQALAAAGNFDPSVWYSVAPDGIVTVTCGKADMGQHIASTMAQIVSEELGSNWKDMRVQLASNDPKFNDPVLGAQITGGSWSTMMNFEAMSRAGAAGRIALTEAAAASMGVPASELVVRDSTITVLERNAQGDIPTLALIMSEFRNDGVTHVATISSVATQAALKAFTDRPIIFGAVANPYIIGAGTTPTSHRPNVTGAEIPLPVDTAIFLAHEAFPWALVERIGVHSPGIVHSVSSAIHRSAHRPMLEIKSDWYY